MKRLALLLPGLVVPLGLVMGCPSAADSEQAVRTETLKQGTGAVAEKGDTVLIHFASRLDDGRPIENTRENAALGMPNPQQLVLGRGRLNLGLDTGVEGMRVGGRRRLTIPATLSPYSAQLAPGVRVIMDVELVAIENMPDLAPEQLAVSTLKVIPLSEGTGPPLQWGQTFSVHYTGWLTDGTRFDGSRGSEPFSGQLGAGEVIQGWERGLHGMKIGGRRRLIVPPHLGYGQRGGGEAIPPGATLVFDIELLNIDGLPDPSLAPATRADGE